MYHHHGAFMHRTFIAATLFICALITNNARATVISTAVGLRATGYVSHDATTPKTYISTMTSAPLPPAYDLRAIGLVTPVKDQGQCGSCWAFAITGALESSILKSAHKTVDLAEQQMVSCDTAAGGCDGGDMTDANYIVIPGLAAEKAYPYTATNSACMPKLPPITAHAARWAYVGKVGRRPTTAEIKAAVVQYGAVFVTVAAGQGWEGAANITYCKNPQTNHMVNIVGWLKDGRWIVRNQWSAGWGDGGYAYMKPGCDKIAAEADSAAVVVGPIAASCLSQQGDTLYPVATCRAL